MKSLFVCKTDWVVSLFEPEQDTWHIMAENTTEAEQAAENRTRQLHRGCIIVRVVCTRVPYDAVNLAFAEHTLYVLLKSPHVSSIESGELQGVFSSEASAQEYAHDLLEPGATLDWVASPYRTVQGHIQRGTVTLSNPLTVVYFLIVPTRLRLNGLTD
jgi:hypothetical protein